MFFSLRKSIAIVVIALTAVSNSVPVQPHVVSHSSLETRARSPQPFNHCPTVQELVDRSTTLGWKSTLKDTGLFWHGIQASDALAEAYRKRPGSTHHKMIRDVFPDNSDIVQKCADPSKPGESPGWMRMSEAFAMLVSGSVVVIGRPEKQTEAHREFNPPDVFWDLEWETLKANKQVTEITRVNYLFGSTTTITSQMNILRRHTK